MKARAVITGFGFLDHDQSDVASRTWGDFLKHHGIAIDEIPSQDFFNMVAAQLAFDTCGLCEGSVAYKSMAIIHGSHLHHNLNDDIAHQSGSLGAWIAHTHGIHGPVIHADDKYLSPLTAIGQGFLWITRHEVQAALCGGVFYPDHPTKPVKYGFVVVENFDHAKERQAKILCEIHHYHAYINTKQSTRGNPQLLIDFLLRYSQENNLNFAESEWEAQQLEICCGGLVCEMKLEKFDEFSSPVYSSDRPQYDYDHPREQLLAYEN